MHDKNNKHHVLYISRNTTSNSGDIKQNWQRKMSTSNL